MDKNIRTIIFTGILAFILLFGLNAYALTVTFPNPLQSTTLNDIVNVLIDLLFKIGIILVPLFIIYGAFMIATAGGNPEQVSRGRKIIVWTCVGLVFLLLFRGLFDLVLSLLGA